MKTPDNERLNFRRFVSFEQKKAWSPDDFEELIGMTEADKKSMRDTLVYLRKEEKWKELIIASGNAKVLMSGEEIAFSEDDWRNVEEAFYKSFRDGNTYEALKIATRARIIDPTRLPLPEAIVARIREKVANTRQVQTHRQDMWTFFLNNAAGLKMIIGEDVSVSTEEKQLIREELERIRPHEYERHQFIEDAALFRILLPDEELNLGKEDWLNMEKFLQSCHGFVSTDYPRYAADLKILAAKEVRVPPQGGLVLTMPEPAAKNMRDVVPPLPAASHLP